LILSEFAGASHELTSALIVNPYHAAQVADALHQGLVMPAAEQRERMRSLRATAKTHNVYRWAAHMLLDATELRDSRNAPHPSHSLGGLLARA
jgi:trehalose-6-phosphate synthase